MHRIGDHEGIMSVKILGIVDPEEFIEQLEELQTEAGYDIQKENSSYRTETIINLKKICNKYFLRKWYWKCS